MRSDHTPISYRFALLAGAMSLACLVNTGPALAQLTFFSSPVGGRDHVFVVWIGKRGVEPPTV